MGKKKKEVIQLDCERLHMAFERLMEVFDELAEKGVTEGELVMAAHFAFEARLLTIYTANLLNTLVIGLAEQQREESYAS
ncbi:MAG: hypothetical protein DRP01_00960 [Archaeoglobales archaeon]|nr:MAG: hypothetical protein DRP01_00960 [Archaeoglobales archaeon]